VSRLRPRAGCLSSPFRHLKIFLLTTSGVGINGIAKTQFGAPRAPDEGVGNVKCHFHPKVDADAICSVCGVPLCKICQIEDGEIYCEDCYAEQQQLEERREDLESEDYIDMELMDLLDTEDDPGLF